MVEGYNRRNRAAGVYFRETYALEWNQWQAKNAKTPEFISPSDVLLLPGEKAKRKVRAGSKAAGWSEEAIRKAAKKHSNPPPTP